MNDGFRRTPLVPRIALVLLLAALVAPVCADVESATRTYEGLLGQYATTRGVKYEAWRSSGADLKAISEVVMNYRSTDVESLSPAEREAVLINLYNSKVLEMILYSNPRSSIKDLSKKANSAEIFSRGTINLNGRVLSLNDLEKRIREESKDPRVHCALNCGARSCPPLHLTPFAAAALDSQLDDACRAFLAAPRVVEIRREGGHVTFVAPKIFDWYADDFKAVGGAAAFIGKYGPADAAEASTSDKVKLEFAEYDWGLNGAK